METLILCLYIGLFVCVLVKVLAFVCGFSLAALWHAVLKPIGSFLHRVHLLLPVSLSATMVVAFLLAFSNVFDREWSPVFLFVGILAFCGLLTWLLFDVIIGNPVDKSDNKEL